MSEEIEAGARLALEFDQFESIKAVFWLKASDEDQRYLYLATEQVGDIDLNSAYEQIFRLTNRMNSPYLDPFRVKVIGGDDPLALEAAEIHTRFPGTRASRYGGSSFGGLMVDDVYLYPSPIPVVA